MSETVWLFHGEGAKFASAVFKQFAIAEAWIAANKFSGMLTEYPVDISVLDMHLAEGLFKPKNDTQCSREFRQGFTSAVQAHFHYTDGSRE